MCKGAALNQTHFYMDHQIYNPSFCFPHQASQRSYLLKAHHPQDGWAELCNCYLAATVVFSSYLSLLATGPEPVTPNCPT